MNELPSQRQGAPPPYSSDGRWWWDGQRWIPVQQAPAQLQSSAFRQPSQAIRPGRYPAWVAALLGLPVFLSGLAILLGILMIVFPTQNDDRQAGTAIALIFLAIGACFSVAMIGIVKNAT